MSKKECTRIMNEALCGTARPIIAIDGPSGTGKSTIAQRLALRLGCRYVDTGAMYRAVALMARQHGVSIDDPQGLAAMLHDFPIDYRGASGGWRVFLAGRDVTDALRLPGVGEDASRLSRFAQVRSLLVEKQRALAREEPVVMEGRDIGTVVLPQADLKIFLEADEEERVARRVRQWNEQGIRASTVYPGQIDTTIWDSIPGSWDRAAMGKPDDVAEAVLKAYLAPDEVNVDDLDV